MIRFIARPVFVPGRHAIAQTELAARLRAQLDGVAGAERIRQLIGFTYAQTGIEARHFELELEPPKPSRGWLQRVNRATESLATRALARLFAGAELADSCDGLVVVSSSYYGFPALSRRLQARFGLPVGALCFDLAGLGCAGPTHALALADTLVRTGQSRQVAVICVDAMGTHGEARVHRHPPSMSQLVAHSLASDAAAALIVRENPSPGTVLSYHHAELDSRLWAESLADNDFTADADDQPYLAVGNGIRTRIADELAPLLARLEPTRTLVHPGGAALLRALSEAAPELAPTLELSRAVMAEHGNVGAASLLAVLDRALTSQRPLGPDLALLALGPGIVTTCLRLFGVEVEHD